MKPPVIVTGFEPFGGRATNPAGELAFRLDGQRVSGRAVHGFVLPVEFETCARILRDKIQRDEPELVISLGLAPSRHVLSLERVAINLDDARIPDNAGSAAH